MDNSGMDNSGMDGDNCQIAGNFHSQGFAVVPPVIDREGCHRIAHSQSRLDGPGTRRLLDFEWCCEVAQLLKRHPAISNFLPADPVAVQCTGFDKTPEKNWLVAYHQDLSIPVAEHVTVPELTGWSHKEGVTYVQPPDHVLLNLVAVRLHLDPCGLENGPLRVIPGSHVAGRLSDEAIDKWRDHGAEATCAVEQGGALIMRPLLLHASSKATAGERRRVLHFLFGPKALPFGLTWQWAI